MKRTSHYSPAVHRLQSIFLSFSLLSVHTLPSGTPRSICPPSSAIHFSLLNYSSNVEVFICSSVSQCPTTLLCLAAVVLSLAWTGEFAHQQTEEGKRDTKQLNKAERWAEKGEEVPGIEDKWGLSLDLLSTLMFLPRLFICLDDEWNQQTW